MRNDPDAVRGIRVPGDPGPANFPRPSCPVVSGGAGGSLDSLLPWIKLVATGVPGCRSSRIGYRRERPHTAARIKCRPRSAGDMVAHERPDVCRRRRWLGRRHGGGGDPGTGRGRAAPDRRRAGPSVRAAAAVQGLPGRGTRPPRNCGVHEPEWYPAHGVELLLGTRVTGIDRQSGAVELSDDSPDRLRPTAAGDRERPAPAAGAGQPSWTGCTTCAGSATPTESGPRSGAGGPLVVVGGGWIGLEVAAVARQAGLDVTVVEPLDQPLLRVLGAQVGGQVRRAAPGPRRGRADRCGGDGHPRRGGRSRRSGSTDGTLVPAAAVVIGVGIRPLTSWPRRRADGGRRYRRRRHAADVGSERSGRPETSPARRTTGPGGGCGSSTSPTPPIRASLAGRLMAGADERWAKPPYFWTDQYDLGDGIPRLGRPAGVHRGAPGRPGGGHLVRLLAGRDAPSRPGCTSTAGTTPTS